MAIRKSSAHVGRRGGDGYVYDRPAGLYIFISLPDLLLGLGATPFVSLSGRRVDWIRSVEHFSV